MSMDRKILPKIPQSRRWIVVALGVAAPLGAVMTSAFAEGLRQPGVATPVSYNRPWTKSHCDCDCDCAQPHTAGAGAADMGATGGDTGMGQAGDVPGQDAAMDLESFQDYDTVASSPTSLMPNMIGDTSGGGCGGIFIGGFLAASVAHPTFACSRLNIAENNSPIVRDRIYYSYRHFHNASEVDIFSYSPQGRAGALDINRHTVAFEKTLSDVTSIELRVPINSQLNSSLHFVQTDSGATMDGSNNNLDELLNDTETELGNIDIILKRTLMDTGTLYVSGGLGVNIPTAQDVRVRGSINDPNFQVYDANLSLQQNVANGPLNGAPPTGDSVLLEFDGTYNNETVNLSPFLAFAYAPNDAWFTQGFMQVDVPLNESTGTLGIFLDVDDALLPGVQYDTLNNPESAQISLQTLLRLNYGVGRWIYQDNTSYVSKLGVMLEAHYTTTLNDAEIISLDVLGPNAIVNNTPGVTAGFGNLNNRVDVVNGVLGIPMLVGKTSIYNGFVVPLSSCNCNRGFDFEYMFSINRHF